MSCPMEEFCQAEQWYILFSVSNDEMRTWIDWQKDFCTNGEYLQCYFYKAKVFWNPSKRFSQSERVKEVIRILEGKNDAKTGR